MPQPQDLAGNAKRAAKSVVRRGLDKVPGAARLARAAYFTGLNWATTQQLAYRAWLDLRSTDAASRIPIGRTASPTVTVVLDVVGQSEDGARRAVARVLAQTYEDWDLTVTADTATTLGLPQSRRHRVLVSAGSSAAERMNAALAACDTDFVVFVGPDDVLYPDTLAALAASVVDGPPADIAYGGDDIAVVTVDRRGVEHVARRDPFFKPDWNPELLHSTPYLGTVSFLRTARVVAASGLRDLPGAELWDLQLRLTRLGATVVHADGIVAGRTTARPQMAGKTATTLLREALTAESSPSCTVASGHLPGTWSVHYPVVDDPLVSIVIPSKNALDVVRRCVESIYSTTAYRAFEVVLVDTGSDDPSVLEWYADMARLHESFRVVDWPERPFSYANSCNAGAAEARGEILLMLNNDTEVLEPSWLEVMVGEAQRPEVGIVGCLLLYPDRLTVQHAGIGLGIKSVAGNSLAGLRLDGRLSRTQRLMLWARRTTTAVTAACIAVRKTVYDEVSGFDPELRITFNDVDLCLRVGAKGYRIVYTPDVRLLHHESKTIAPTRDWGELYAAGALFRSRWGDLVARDPQMNRHLARTTTSYRLPFHGR
ncbi:MAG: glycosyltransferase family 2 protein [Propionibacteriaceae bacterium]